MNKHFQVWDEAVTIYECHLCRGAAGQEMGMLDSGQSLVMVGGPVVRNDLRWWQVGNVSPMNGGWVNESVLKRVQ